MWDAVTGKQIGEPMKHEAAGYSAQFSPDGQRVVTASEDETRGCGMPPAANQLAKRMKHNGIVKSAQFSPMASR